MLQISQAFWPGSWIFPSNPMLDQNPLTIIQIFTIFTTSYHIAVLAMVALPPTIMVVENDDFGG